MQGNYAWNHGLPPPFTYGLSKKILKKLNFQKAYAMVPKKIQGRQNIGALKSTPRVHKSK